MIISSKRIVFIFTLIVIVTLCLNYSKALALEVETHRAINEMIAKGSFLDNYLKKQLGMQDGKDTYFDNKRVFNIIGNGGIYEDKPPECTVPYQRSRNHFHNPIDNSGFSGIWDTGFLSGMSVLDWIFQPLNTQSCGYYSWNDARKYFYTALTATDNATRETNFAKTFRALGQTMHLMQDMSVPEHTRNDGHYFAYDYEKWMDEEEHRNAIANFSAIGFVPNISFSLNIKNLFDTDRYNGTNPGITTSSNIIGLAEYTNANFFSGDTINAANFPSPKTDNNRKLTLPYTGAETTYNREYFLKDCSSGYCETSTAKSYIGYLLSAVDFNDYWRMQNLTSSELLPVIPVLDENVYYDYSQFLIPRAIGYSSQVLNYFFRGQLDVVLGDGNIKIKNISTDTISNGEFKLYYDNAGGVRTLLTSATANTLVTGNEQTINFSLPEGVTATSYMLVFQGQLGAEPNAVIAKFIPADNELVVITVSIGQKAVSFVWNPASNSLERASIDNTDANFQSWYSTRKQIADQTNLFGSPNTCGVSSLPFVNGSQPSACPEITSGMLDTAYNEDVLGVFSGWWGDEGFWACYTNTYSSGVDIKAYFDSTVFSVLLPKSPVSISGFRKRLIYENKGVISESDSVGDGPYYGFRGSVLATSDYIYYGPLGEFGSFHAFTESTGDIIYGYAPHSYKKYYIGSTDSKVIGIYSKKNIANISIVQILGRTDTHIAVDYDWDPGTTTFAYDEARTIFVQAQALYVPEGTTGYNWVGAGRNAALETQIIAALNMAYSLNGIPANEIRSISINIELVE